MLDVTVGTLGGSVEVSGRSSLDGRRGRSPRGLQAPSKHSRPPRPYRRRGNETVLRRSAYRLTGFVPPTKGPHMSPTRDSYDAIIVGARPAGSATAMLLARAGLDVLVLERSHYGDD